MKLPKYHNAEVDKAKILSDNKNKAGIYMWINTINDKRYIGSAVDLTDRLRFYYSYKGMVNSLKNSQSYIYNALLKHGHSNFALTILEYCSPEKCLEREGYYQTKLNPEYNIAKEPGAPMYGRKHSDETKIIMSDAKKGENNPNYGQTLSDDTKTKISDAQKKIDNSGRFKTGENNPNYGQPRTEGAGKPSQQIEVTDSKNNTTTTYDSISEAARALNIPNHSIISNYIKNNQQKPYKGIYTFKKV